ncbi:hypothetical protein [Bosea sp. PAMC 26642]|uniref:hypothetical protein n=1 Tax=Bosea sp. (strain PAMC 26642) TaxID=1792307 RepID=UPI0012E7122E|nr:hypothetical protein [Bosea sp. PAMC 26642]
MESARAQEIVLGVEIIDIPVPLACDGALRVLRVGLIVGRDDLAPIEIGQIAKGGGLSPSQKRARFPKPDRFGESDASGVESTFQAHTAWFQAR